MVRVGFIGDLHFTDRNYKEMHKALALACDALIKEECKLVIQLGDVFDRFNISGSQVSVGTVVKAAKDPLVKLTHHGIEVLIVEGNHDKGSRGLQDDLYMSSLGLMQQHTTPGIRTVHEICCVEYPEIDVVVQCIPWIVDLTQEEIVAAAHKLNADFSTGFKILAGHFVLEGSQQWNHELTHGDCFLSKQNVDDFKCQVAAAGHIHHRQLIYNGVIMHNDLRDAGSPTGVRVVGFNQDTGEILEDRFLELRTPQYRLLEITSENPEEIEAFIKQFYNEFDNFVCRIHGKRQGHIPFPPNVTPEYIQPKVQRVRATKMRDNVKNLTVIDMFKMWGELNNLNPEKIEKAAAIIKADAGV